MLKNRLLSIMAALALATFVGCADGADETMETTDTEIITQPGTETVEVTVPTTDTLMVERTVETNVDVDVDTTEVEGEATVR